MTPTELNARQAICSNCPALTTCKQSEQLETGTCPKNLWPISNMQAKLTNRGMASQIGQRVGGCKGCGR